MLDYWITDFQKGLLSAIRDCFRANAIAAEFTFPESQFQPKQLGVQRSTGSPVSELIVISGILYDTVEGTHRGLRFRLPVIQIAAFSRHPNSALELRSRAEKAMCDSFSYEFCESWRFLNSRGPSFDRSSGVHFASRDVLFSLKPCPVLFRTT